MARRARHTRFSAILLWTIVLGFTIAAGAIFYKAFQEGTENRTKAALEGTSYYAWTFNRFGNDYQGWRPTNLTLSYNKDKDKNRATSRYLQGIVGSGDTASLSRIFTDGKVLPAGVKKLKISMAVLPAGYATIQKQQTMSQSTPVSSSDDGVGRVNQSSWSRVEQVKDAVSRYCPLPATWERLSDKQKMMIDPDPYWCMKPTPVPVTPGPCPNPPDWPYTRNGQEIMMYPRPDWCKIVPSVYPVPSQIPYAIDFSMLYQPVSGLERGKSEPAFADGNFREYTLDLDSLNEVQLSLVRFTWHNLPKDSVVKINWIRVTGQPWKSSGGCYTIQPNCKPGQVNCPKFPSQRICPTPTPTPKPTATPTPPVGCYYQDVQCIKAPCNPVLVCPVPNP